MTEFTYSLTDEDYIRFEKFKLKRNKTVFIVYIISLFYVAMSIYDAIVYKAYDLIFITIGFVILICAATAYVYFAAPKKRVRKMLAADSTYTGENSIKIGEKEIEIKNLPRENQRGMVAVYPYSVMSAIYETEESYYFLIGMTVKILPKRVIPPVLSDYVKKTLSKNGNYIYLK